MDPGKDVEFLHSDKIDTIVKEIQDEKEAEAARKKSGRSAPGVSTTSTIQ